MAQTANPIHLCNQPVRETVSDCWNRRKSLSKAQISLQQQTRSTERLILVLFTIIATVMTTSTIMRTDLPGNHRLPNFQVANSTYL